MPPFAPSSRHSSVWRFVASAALILAAASLLVTAKLYVKGKQDARNFAEQIAATSQRGNLVACHAGNEVRAVIRQIVRSGDRQVDQYVTDGTITPAQAVRAHQQNLQAIVKLHDRDCTLSIITPYPGHF